VVAENFVNKATEGTIEEVDAKYELLQRGQYVLNRSMYKQPKVDPKGPLQLGQAENAVQIARAVDVTLELGSITEVVSGCHRPTAV
jgi:hypothetical protein